jgi:hypothetical protein
VHVTHGGIGDLLSFHVAPFWQRMGWATHLSPFAELIGEWVDVKRWLDAAVAQPVVQATAPDRDVVVAAYRANSAGA